MQSVLVVLDPFSGISQFHKVELTDIICTYKNTRVPRIFKRLNIFYLPGICFIHSSQDELSSGSISDRRAIFENAKNNSNNSPSRPSAVATKRDHSQSNKHNKSRDDTAKYGKSNDGSSRLSATKLKKTSTRKDSSFDRNGAPDKLTPRLERLGTTADESCDFNYDDEENPFDISSILRAANEAGPEESPQPEFKQSAWNVLDYLTEDSPKVHSPKVTSPDRGMSHNHCQPECFAGTLQ